MISPVRGSRPTSRGIGRMIAAGFIAQGAKLYITARKAAACGITAAELSTGGGQCIALPVDTSTVAGAQALANALLAQAWHNGVEGKPCR